LGHGGSTLVGGCGLAVVTQLAKRIGSRGVEWVVAVQGQLVHQRQRGGGALHLADGDGDGDGAAEGYDRRGGDGKQPVVQAKDLRPVLTGPNQTALTRTPAEPDLPKPNWTLESRRVGRSSPKTAVDQTAPRLGRRP
jgi:hypothetical protein